MPFHAISHALHALSDLIHKRDDKVHTDQDDMPALTRQISKRTAKQFARVLGTVRIDEASALALSYRRSLEKGHQTRRDRRKSKVTCQVMTPPFNGFYNLVYRVQFSDGVTWALKIPRRGHVDDWTEIAARGLTSEARTMQLLKSATTIPLPDVYAFDAGHDNDLGCPFIMMEWLAAEPLINYWDRYVNRPNRFDDEKHRVQLLLDLASHVVQLERFQFDRAGTPTFDESGKLTGVGPIVTRNLGIENFEQMPELIEVGPFQSGDEFMSWKIDLYGPENDDQARNGHQDLFRMFLSWVQEIAGVGECFVFAHNDFGPQNVLVDEDGRLCGIIDFDGIMAVPRCLGNGVGGAYPHWLTRDQDLWDGEEVLPASCSSGAAHNTFLPGSSATSHHDTINHEEADFWRAVWRLCLENATSIASSQGFHPGISVEGILGSVPRTYATGLTPACSLDGRILSIAASSPDTMLPKIVESIVNRIIHFDNTWPSLLSGSTTTGMTRNTSTLTIAALNALPGASVSDSGANMASSVPALSSSRPSVSTDLSDVISNLTMSTEPTVYSDNESVVDSVMALSSSKAPSVSAGPQTSSIRLVPTSSDETPAALKANKSGGAHGLGDGRGQQSAAGGLAGFRSKNMIVDIGRGRLCEEDRMRLKAWFMYLYAGRILGDDGIHGMVA